MSTQQELDNAALKGRAIERISTQLVAVPLEEPIKHPFMGARTQKATLIVQVHTGDGAVGLGYVSIESVRLVRAVEAIIKELEPALQGVDATRRNFIFERMWNMTVDLLHDGAANLALSAIDFALWDLAGKLANTPLWRLLGGYRTAVPAYASWALWRHHDAARLAVDAAKIVEQGFTGMKLRMGNRPYAEDMARAKLVRDTVGPDIHIMVDALWSMSALEGVQIARGLGELGYTWLEEPVREGDFAGLAKVRAEQALPIAAGERISRLAQIETLVPHIDHAILDVAHLGGITPWLKAVAAIEGHNLPVSGHSHAFVHLHLLAASRCGAWVEYMPWLDALFIDPPTPVKGLLHMSEKPGLGLELDAAAVKRYAVA